MGAINFDATRLNLRSHLLSALENEVIYPFEMNRANFPSYENIDS